VSAVWAHDAARRAVIDDLGAEVPLPQTPRRVVSLVPSITETVALAAPGVLVGATSYCTHPPNLDVSRVGGSKYPKVPAVLALQPDLVLANEEENRRQDVNALRAEGVPVWTTAAPATVPAALHSLRRMLTDALRIGPPAWLDEAERAWLQAPPQPRATAIVCVWRRPWVVLGRDTFAGDVLRRLGIANAYADHRERYPRPSLAELHDLLRRRHADLIVLPDEPYAFSAADGPEAFPGARCALLSGRHLTWWGPSLLDARAVLAAGLP
jgi:ABC-type Fe3+-hydroxamate transport system substrate-binding protein